MFLTFRYPTDFCYSVKSSLYFLGQVFSFKVQIFLWIILLHYSTKSINLTKEVQDLYFEKYKTLMKGTEEDNNKLNNIPYS